jgi:2-C-methyl-D-erythritol 4-phosphate cytidylyltransferase
MGADLPKQLLPLGGRKVLEYALATFTSALDRTVVVAHPDWMEAIRSIADFPGVIFAPGGETRQLSVFSGLLALETDPPDVVAVHDGARPFCSRSLLERCIREAGLNGCGIAGVVSRSTVALLSEGELTSFVPRDSVCLVQTPQAFRFHEILSAHRAARKAGEISATDDSQLYLSTGHRLYFVPGEEFNLKLTDPLDLKFASLLADDWVNGEGFPDTGGV